MEEYNLSQIAQKITVLKQTALDLKQMSVGFTAVERNVERILADIRLLELDVTDVVDIV
jgi:hypothetical protein